MIGKKLIQTLTTKLIEFEVYGKSISLRMCIITSKHNMGTLCKLRRTMRALCEPFMDITITQ